MPRVSSSAIAWVGYDSRARTLVVGFKQGRAYDYLGVPRHVYRGLLAAPSKGRFYNARVKDVYPFRRRFSTGWRSAARRRGRA